MDKLNIVETKEEIEEKEIIADAKNLINSTDTLEKKSRAKKFVYFFVIPFLILFILIMILSTVFAIFNLKNNNIIYGVFIEGIDVSNLSKEQAKEKVNTIIENHLSNEITLKYGEFTKSITTTQIGSNFNIDSAIDAAFSVGRSRQYYSK